MLMRTSLTGCSLRKWKPEDKGSLVRNANNQKPWRHLTEMFLHPYTEADADRWLAIASQSEPSIRVAIELERTAVGVRIQPVDATD
jgi:ribosomal-protein-alanine N-acetyltransferase